MTNNNNNIAKTHIRYEIHNTMLSYADVVGARIECWNLNVRPSSSLPVPLGPGTTDFFVSDPSRRSVKVNTIKTTDNTIACCMRTTCTSRVRVNARRKKNHFNLLLLLLLVFIYFSVANVVPIEQHHHRWIDCFTNGKRTISGHWRKLQTWAACFFSPAVHTCRKT